MNSLVFCRVATVMVLTQTVHSLFQHTHSAITKVICPAFALTLAVNSTCNLGICYKLGVLVLVLFWLILPLNGAYFCVQQEEMLY